MRPRPSRLVAALPYRHPRPCLAACRGPTLPPLVAAPTLPPAAVSALPLLVAALPYPAVQPRPCAAADASRPCPSAAPVTAQPFSRPSRGPALPPPSSGLALLPPQSRSRSSPASCSCRPLSHETLLWHHRLGHPSLPRLQGMASRTLVSGLPRSLPPLPPGPASTFVPCVEGRQRAAPHSSEFPPTEALLQTLHMDVWGPAHVSGQGHERHFLLVVDDNSHYTTVFPLRHKDRGGDSSSDLLRAFFVRRASARRSRFRPSHNKMGLLSAALTWSWTSLYAAHQINLQPRVSLPETTPSLQWTGKVGDVSVFRVWGSRAFVRDTSADKLSSRAVPCVFLGFPPDAPGWQFYHPTSRRVLSSQDPSPRHVIPFSAIILWLSSLHCRTLLSCAALHPTILTGYTFSLGSGSVSWRSTRSSSVLSSSCEAEIYARAMAAQELCWLTYLLTDLGEPPRSPPVLYVDNKAMLALCREHRLEHRTKHIALRYFLARELQQRGQLRLAYVASQANNADIFTKTLQPCDHQRFCTMLAVFALLCLTGLVTPSSPPLCLWGQLFVLADALYFVESKASDL
ncbi:unnamed protein product [Closterium sp. NIES-53]